MEDRKKGIGMYFNEKTAELFAEREQNEKNFRVAAIVDRTILSEIAAMKGPIHAAELGGGAHPDRYDGLFDRLLREPRSRLDWVDLSPHMLSLAERYLDKANLQDRKKALSFIESDMTEYLRDLSDETLDLVIMKYTIDHLSDLESFMEALAKKLKPNGRLIATIGTLNPELKSHSTNARFLYHGQEFPEHETRTLKDGDDYTVKFFKESGNPAAGYLEGAETTKYYHSPKTLRELAEQYGFELFLGDWKELLPEDRRDGESMDQDILVMRQRAL